MLFCLLLALLAAGWAAEAGVARERMRWLILRNRVEQAAAPGEPVVVDGRLPMWMLHRYGSGALRQQLVEASDKAAIASLLRSGSEMVLVSGDTSGLLPGLRAAGFSVTESSASGRLHIYFAAPRREVR